MNILVISPYILEKNGLGGMIRFVKFVEFLSQRHSVFIACLNDRNQWRQPPELLEGIDIRIVEKPVYSTLRKAMNKLFRIKPSYVINCYSKEMAETINEIIVSKSIDLVHVEFTYMGEYVHDIKKKPLATVLVDQELNFRRIKRELQTGKNGLRLLAFIDYLKLKRYETNICSFFDRIFAITKEEKSVLLETDETLDIDIYPNIVDSDYFSPDRAVTGEPMSIAFVGNYVHKPNETGMLWFHDHVYLLVRQVYPDAHLYVVGANPTPIIQALADDGHVSVTGFVDDTREFLHKCTVFINPVVSGGGMRGKVLEAMACGKPVVTTSIGCEGIDAKHEEHLMIADTPEDFADAVIDVIRDAELREKLSAAGLTLVKNKYNAQAVFSKMEQKYVELAKKVSGKAD